MSSGMLRKASFLMIEPLLLDTHTALWWAAGAEQLNKLARDAITSAVASRKHVLISPITAWEVALATSRGRVRLAVDPGDWYRQFLGLPGFFEVALSADVLVASENLPGVFHRDPADRFLVATARHYRARLVTRDRKILDYAAAGHVLALAC